MAVEIEKEPRVGMWSYQPIISLWRKEFFGKIYVLYFKIWSTNVAGVAQSVERVALMKSSTSRVSTTAISTSNNLC
jgi:hypothetical protein